MSESTPMVNLVEEYLEYRRRLGFQLRIEGQMLLGFTRYADRSGHRGPLTTELAVRWARLPAEAAPLYQARRLEVVRCFARHRAIFDPATEIPPEGLLGSAHRRTAPYIYSEAELSTLLSAARRLPSSTDLRPRTYATLLGLISCTGLRISEALKLSRGDVDWDHGTLTIRESKFHKSRLVPLHPSVVRALREYARLRDRCHPIPQTKAFFVSDRGTMLSASTVRHTFHKLRGNLPGAPQTGTRAPRIHDLRHTFACRRLLRWYADGAGLDHAAAALSTYLGHAKVSDTYWYLTGIPELLGLAAGRFERSSPTSPRSSGSSSASGSSPSRTPAPGLWRRTGTRSACC
jgi:integrase